MTKSGGPEDTEKVLVPQFTRLPHYIVPQYENKLKYAIL